MALLRLPSPAFPLRWGDTERNMTVVNFTKNNTVTGGNEFFVSTPFCETKSTDLKAKPVTVVECVSS